MARIQRNHEMKKHKIIIILQTFLILFLGCILISEHCISFYPNWFDEESPYGKYTIHATFPDGISNFGSTEAQFTVYDQDKNQYINSVVLLVDNNGKRPDNDNYKLEWDEHFVIITVVHYMAKSNSVRIYWEDC